MSDELKTASVIIVNYNYGHFLARAIDSVLCQSVMPAQIIVVDDGSTDNSLEIIKSYDDKITAVTKKNGGHGSAFNAGYAVADSDVVFFLDSDDYMEPNCIETVMSSWEEDVVLVQYYMNLVDIDGKLITNNPFPHWELESGDVREKLLRTGSFGVTTTSALSFRKDALDVVMPLDEKKYTQAAEGFLIRAAALQGNVQVINQQLSNMCRHESNDSNFQFDKDGYIKSLRKQLRYRTNEFDAVGMLAKQFGLDCSSPEELEKQDARYLEIRFYSLVLDPEGHPIPGDSLLKLWRLYSTAQWKMSEKSIVFKMAEIGLASCSMVAPENIAYRLVLLKSAKKMLSSWLKKKLQ